VSHEFWRDHEIGEPPGQANFYVYHPLQVDVWGDHIAPTGIGFPSGLTLAPTFQPRPDFTPQRDRWYSYQFRLKLNSVQAEGVYAADGRLTSWIDGQIVADFPGLVFRYTPDLKIDRVEFALQARNNVQENSIWYDNIVLSTEYIAN
jgi:hypothetical protein